MSFGVYDTRRELGSRDFHLEPCKVNLFRECRPQIIGVIHDATPGGLETRMIPRVVHIDLYDFGVSTSLQEMVPELEDVSQEVEKSSGPINMTNRGMVDRKR